MKDKNILFSLFVFLISVGSCASLSMSPPQINFQGSVNENICSSFMIEGNSIVQGETKWAREGYFERKINEHMLNASELGLEIDYLGEFELNGSVEKDICILAKNPGNYHGILFYKIKDKPLKVGIWMNVSISEKKDKNIGLTGFSVEGNVGNMEMWLGILVICLLGVLWFLLKVKKKP